MVRIMPIIMLYPIMEAVGTNQFYNPYGSFHSAYVSEPNAHLSICAEWEWRDRMDLHHSLVLEHH